MNKNAFLKLTESLKQQKVFKMALFFSIYLFTGANFKLMFVLHKDALFNQQFNMMIMNKL